MTKNEIIASIRRGANFADCWEWQGLRYRDGYGRVCYQGKEWRVHRLIWFWKRGEHFRDDLHVLHKCDNPLCVRPLHLFEGTQADNMADAVKKGRHKNPILKGEASPSKRSEVRAKISAAMLANHPFKGKHFSVETRQRMSLAQKRRFASGQSHPMLGRQHSWETRRKISDSHKNVSEARLRYYARGKNSPESTPTF